VLTGCAAGRSTLVSFWKKDVGASDSMNEAMDLIQLNWLLRKAVSVISGVQLQLTPDAFDFVVCSHIKWFRVRETFPVKCVFPCTRCEPCSSAWPVRTLTSARVLCYAALCCYVLCVCSGEARRHQRRDMRGGGAAGVCTVTHEGISLALEWADPLAGTEHMLFSVSPDGGTLTVRCRVSLHSGQRCVYTTVYRRD
jgi:hypothetical protein